MLQTAIDYLASLDLDNNYYYNTKFITTSRSRNLKSVTQSLAGAESVKPNKIQLPRNIVDRAIDFLRTPFPAETKQKLRYMRAVLP